MSGSHERYAHPTSLAFYLANGYREGEWRDKGPVPATLIRVGKRVGAPNGGAQATLTSTR
jgi:hypothetical protein